MTRYNPNNLSPTSSLSMPGSDSSKKLEEEHLENAHSPKIHVDLANNSNARIANPLAGLTREELLAQVDTFCVENGFKDQIPLFQRGALVAQNPEEFESLKELTQDELYHLRRETTHKWTHPRALYFTIFVTSLGAAIQGWDNTGANGGNLTFPEEFGIAHNGWLIGAINSAPTIMGLMSTWTTDYFNNLWGRRGVVFFTGLFCVGPVLGQAFTHNWWELLICRLFLGIGIGIKISTIPIYSSEIVPASIRGGLVMSFQLWVAFGILFGFCVNLMFYRIGPLAWRFQLGSAFVPAVPLLLLVWFCPESPRWLLKKGRLQASFDSFCRLRNSPLQAARDLYYAHAQIKVEEEVFGGSTYLGRVVDLFTVPRLRRATLGSFIVMLSQQLSGINIMAFYSSTIFSTAGYDTRSALLASFGFGVVNTLFALPAIWTIDTFGRRNLLLFTFPNMAWCLFLVAGMFKINTEFSGRVPLIAFFIYLFTAFYSPGIGPCPAVWAAESFPLSHRDTGMAWSIFINNTFSTILGLTFPTLLMRLGPTGAFCFYGGTNLLATVMIFLGLPETKQRTLEELDHVFAVPSSRFASYQCKTWLPWFIKRYVLFQSSAQLEPLYHLENVTGAKTYVTAVVH